jgi:hypothetical protein
MTAIVLSQFRVKLRSHHLCAVHWQDQGFQILPPLFLLLSLNTGNWRQLDGSYQVSCRHPRSGSQLNFGLRSAAAATTN